MSLIFTVEDFIIKIFHRKPRKRIVISTTINGITIKGERMSVEFTKIGQKAQFSIEILDVKDRPAKVQGDELKVDNTNPASVGVSFDQATRAGSVECLDEGIWQVTLTGDADLGEGVEPIVGIIDGTGPDLTKATKVKVNVGPIQDPPTP